MLYGVDLVIGNARRVAFRAQADLHLSAVLGMVQSMAFLVG